jgi:hypothetical protein
MLRCTCVQDTQVAFTSFFTGDITYSAFITMPPEWMVIDYVEIQLWAGRMAFLSQVRTRATAPAIRLPTLSGENVLARPCLSMNE